MSDMEKAKAIVRALRCTCTSGSECEGKACAFYLDEVVDEKTRALIGDTVWRNFDVVRIGLDAAEILEALMEENERLTHALKLQQMHASAQTIDHDTKYDGDDECGDPESGIQASLYEPSAECL